MASLNSQGQACEFLCVDGSKKGACDKDSEI